MKKASYIINSALLIATLSCINPVHAIEEELELARSLTQLILSAREIVVDNPSMIIKPERAPKADIFVQKTLEKYNSKGGITLDLEDPLIQALLDSISIVITNAKKGAYKGNWVNHKQGFKFYEKRFLPARFAELLTQEFTRQSNNRAIAKLTVPDDFLSIVRDGDENKPTRADAWEREMLVSSSPKGKLLTQRATVQGRDAYRYLDKEYYTSGCLMCHGSEKGERLHLGKKPGKEGDIGGAISLTLFDKTAIKE